MECQNCSFGGAVGINFGKWDETSHATNGYNVTFLSFEHVWKEFLYCEPMWDGVHVEKFAKVTLWCIENGIPLHDTCIVDENRWRSIIFSDCRCNFMKINFVGDVALIEGDFWVWMFWWVSIF